MRKNIIAASIATALAVPAAALPSLSVAAEQSPHTLTGNFGVFTDYRFRGISQTFKRPAVQGGIDYSHSSGFYLGNWNSSVSGLSYANAAGIEMDFYGGYKGSFGDFGFDVGLLQYYYPNARIVGAGTRTKYDTLEGYLGLSWKWLSAKYSHTFTDYFGFNSSTLGGVCNRNGVDCYGANPGKSKGSGYLELNASYEVMPKLTLNGHIGNQKVKHYSKHDYTDWKVGLSYDWNSWLLSAAYVDTDADKKWYFLTDGAGKTEEIGKGTVVLSIGKTF